MPHRKPELILTRALSLGFGHFHQSKAAPQSRRRSCTSRLAPDRSGSVGQPTHTGREGAARLADLAAGVFHEKVARAGYTVGLSPTEIARYLGVQVRSVPLVG